MNFSNVKAITIPEGKVSRILTGDRVLWSAGLLPSAYQRVAYIHTDGDCCIDSDVIPADYPDGIRIDLDFTLTEYITGNVYTYYFGCKTSECYANCFTINPTSGNFRAYVGSSAVSTYKWVNVLNQRTLISMTSTTEVPHDTVVSLKINGVEQLVKNTTNTTSARNMPNESIHLLNCRNSGRKGNIGDCCGSAMYAADGTPIRYFVPCYRKTDSEIGLYDAVEGRLHTNIGTGSFTKGPDV